MNPAQVLFILFLLTVLAIAVAYQRIHVVSLGYSLQQLRQTRGDLQEENRRLLCHINTLCDPARLLRLAKEGKVQLAQPSTLLLLEVRSAQQAQSGRPDEPALAASRR